MAVVGVVAVAGLVRWSVLSKVERQYWPVAVVAVAGLVRRRCGPTSGLADKGGRYTGGHRQCVASGLRLYVSGIWM